MPIFQLCLGVAQQIAQNEVWALPSCACLISTTVALEGSFSPGGPWVAVPGSPGPGTQMTAAGYIRCPTAAATVMAKKG